MVVFRLAFDMGLMGRNVENGKKLTTIQILDIVSMNNKHIVTCVGISSDIATMNSISNE